VGGGWNGVVNKGEFAAEDKSVYFEIDSMIPLEGGHTASKFLDNLQHDKT
jgi:hypothetical protein